ncbi:MAG: CinA family protein [Lachnospiraceae bacterium]|nr:CinA family protein [Lachnospiraceae bacterium]
MQNVREHYHQLTKQLIDKGLTITTMESATSGQIASLITDTEGSSAVLPGAFVTYSNRAKILQGGVPAEVIETYSVYSEETARAMASACRRAYGTDIGVGVTGTMGNVDPDNAQDSVPGEVYLAVETGEGIWSRKIVLEPRESRLDYKLAVAEEVYKLLEMLIGLRDISGDAAGEHCGSLER